MITFIGDYPCKVDSKGRILLPAAFKKQMGERVIDRFVVKKAIFEKSLWLYPYEEWERQISILRSKINPYNRAHAEFLREFFKGTAEITLDNNNRLLIPKRLLEWASIHTDVVLVGQDDKIVIWDKQSYDKQTLSDEDFAALAEKILGGNDNTVK
ncbi:MAG: division/cell wall cluster transcriptional repressor MraZ [Bacteroidales bacterium]|nr:division/cell wall cluster transcriptional repressor MraZ [Bacteroidales bacterium]